MLVWRKGNIEKKTVSVLEIVYYYDGAQMYEQFLHVGRLCLRFSWCYIGIKIFSLTVHPSLYLLVS